MDDSGHSDDPADRWRGLNGVHPLDLSPSALDALLPIARERISASGTTEGRLSLAACFISGLEVLRAADSRTRQRFSPSEAVLTAVVGALGHNPTRDVDALTALANAWFNALDAAGANDRIRAFSDAVDRIERHDNPQGLATSDALIVELADRPLALEPLPRRLMPGEVLSDPEAIADADAAYPQDRSRRVPLADETRHKIAGPGSEELAEALQDAFERGRELGLDGPEVTLGDIMAATGVDPNGAQDEFLSVMEDVDPVVPYAYLATDGLILTEMNEHLVDPVVAQRWKEAGGTYQEVLEGLDELASNDFDEDEHRRMDTAIHTSGSLLEELVACVQAGTLDAAEYMLGVVRNHPAGRGILEELDVIAFTELSIELEDIEDTSELSDVATRLARARFADNPQILEAVERGSQMLDVLRRGDAAFHAAAPDRRPRMWAWACLIAAARAVHPPLIDGA